ncbi:hypothetical protein EUX98_g1736 [Antrodiella citrinella]|uniref:F-box domain-containing protein n=1 Tax=Antrodiella citrinella TaxID=2447956 RepID=A0A4S4N0Q0_9APHY|nr:hypothetical protein EUX98_g1736 [Antrodiella citrinella]
MPLLESLEIALFTAAAISDLPQVALPSLRHFYLENLTNGCKDIFNHLTVPIAAFRSGSVRGINRHMINHHPHQVIENPPESMLLLRQYCETVLHKVTGDHGVIGIMQSPNTLAVTVDHTWDVLFEAWADETKVFAFRYVYSLDAGNALDRMLSAAPRQLLTALRSLTISNEVRDDDSCSDWLLSLSELAGLETLHLKRCRGIIQPPAYHLYHPTTALFPKLRTLSLTDIAFGTRSTRFGQTGVFADIYCMLDLRKREGSPLALLKIRNARDLTAGDAACLCTLVDELEWDRKVSMSTSYSDFAEYCQW